LNFPLGTLHVGTGTTDPNANVTTMTSTSIPQINDPANPARPSDAAHVVNILFLCLFLCEVSVLTCFEGYFCYKNFLIWLVTSFSLSWNLFRKYVVIHSWDFTYMYLSYVSMIWMTVYDCSVWLLMWRELL
jgi:hypothetical protein